MGDADITLRHITRHHPEAIARALVPGGNFAVLGWADTQVTALERRLDKALGLHVRGARRILHIEFEIDFHKDVPYRVFEYQALLVMGLRGEAPTLEPPPVDSVVIVLRGRRESFPSAAEFRTGWPEREF